MVQFYSDSELQAKHDSVYQSLVPPHQVLPPGIGEAEFAKILDEFRAIVGRNNVAAGTDLINFKDPYPLDENSHQASAALCPETVEEIQAILKVANRYALPIWTCSQGKNFGYGGPAPRLDGSIVLSLHQMKRIIEVNEKHAYIVVEPGVTFIDIYEYLRDHNINLWISVPALGWGSVVGNTLDRGHGYTPSGDRQHFIASMEIILPSGEVMRTGQWGASRSASAHLCSNNFGPQVDGLFLQSNLGIVTKLALHVDVAPQTFMAVSVHCPEVGQLSTLIDTLQKLYREGILQNHPHVCNINHFATRSSRKHEQQSEPGPLTIESLEAMKTKFNTGYWRCAFEFFGTKEMVQARFTRVQQLFSTNLPGARLDHQLVLGEDGKPVDNSKLGVHAAGVPSMFAATFGDYNLPADGTGAGAHIDVTLILPGDGKVISDWFALMRELMQNLGADPFIGCHVFDRHILFVQEYVYDKTQASERARGQKIVAAIMAAAKDAGYANYRSHLDHMDAIQDLYDYNSHVYKRFVEQIKAAVDPNGILSPGKQGIWHTRKSR